MHVNGICDRRGFLVRGGRFCVTPKAVMTDGFSLKLDFVPGHNSDGLRSGAATLTKATPGAPSNRVIGACDIFVPHVLVGQEQQISRLHSIAILK